MAEKDVLKAVSTLEACTPEEQAFVIRITRMRARQREGAAPEAKPKKRRKRRALGPQADEEAPAQG